MKYAVFSGIYFVAVSTIYTITNRLFWDKDFWDFAVSEGVGAGAAILLLSSLGFFYKPDRFRGFMVAAVIFNGIHIANMLGWIEKIAQR